MTDSPNEEPSQLALGLNNIRKYLNKTKIQYFLFFFRKTSSCSTTF